MLDDIREKYGWELIRGAEPDQAIGSREAWKHFVNNLLDGLKNFLIRGLFSKSFRNRLLFVVHQRLSTQTNQKLQLKLIFVSVPRLICCCISFTYYLIARAFAL